MKKTHGIRATYIKGCRCRRCRKANNAYMAKYRRERCATSCPPAWRTNQNWEPWEDELVSEWTKTAYQIADMLERTPAAVYNRRRVIKARTTNQEVSARANQVGDDTINWKEEQK